MTENFWLQFNNGKKEQLGEVKHGVRKEQVDKKFHNLFDAYDANQDGTLESEELNGIFRGLAKYAGTDKTLDSMENKEVASLFANQAGIEDADFMGFVKSVSKASEDIVDSKEEPTQDGGKKVVTTYKDGTKETIEYYADGEYKYKKTEKMVSETTYNITINGQTKEITKEEYDKAVKQLEQRQQQQQPKMTDGISFNLPSIQPDVKLSSNTTEKPQIDYDFSERGKVDLSLKNMVLSHYFETHQATQDALDSMGFLDDIGAAINAGAGETWNAIKNKWNGTEEEFTNFYELCKKFEPNYKKATQSSYFLNRTKALPELYFDGFDVQFKKDTKHDFDVEKAMAFSQITEQFQAATVLKQRLACLEKAKEEIARYRAEQDALTYAPTQNEGLNPATHITKAYNLLVQYCNGDKEAADTLLEGAIGNSEATIERLRELYEETEYEFGNCLVKRNVSFETNSDGESFITSESNFEEYTYEELKADYETQYKEMYGTDFVPAELDEKIMNAKMTGGTVKIALITIVSILIAKSPIMAEINGAVAGSAEATGAAANFVRGLVSKYGQEVVAQGIKFAMTTGTVATDTALTLLNQVTDNRDGINGQEVWESTKGAAKYIYFGAYVGSPIAQAVAKKVGALGLTGKVFAGGTKATQGAIETTTITGEKFVSNLMKAGNSVLSKGAGFATDVGAFSLLELATGADDVGETVKGQTEMLGKLKIMNGFLEYLLGGKAHAGYNKVRMESAIEKSGIKNWTIKEVKTPTKTQYIVERDGLPPVRIDDINQLTTAMMENVSFAYQNIEQIEGKSVEEVLLKLEPKPETNPSRLLSDKPQTIIEDAEYVELDANGNPIVRTAKPEVRADIRMQYVPDAEVPETKANEGILKPVQEKFKTTSEILENIDEYLREFNPSDIVKANELLDLYKEASEGYKTCTTTEEYTKVYELDLKISEYLNNNYDKLMSTEELEQKFFDYALEAQGNKAIADNKDFALFRTGNSEVDVPEVRADKVVVSEIKTETTTTTVKTQIEEKLNTVNSREDFVAIRDMIKQLPPSAEKTELQQRYLQRYNEWSSNPNRPDIRMQYVPEAEVKPDDEKPSNKPTTPQGMTIEENAALEKAKGENPKIQEIIGKYSDDFVETYLVDMLEERNNFFKITEELGCPELIEAWVRKTVEENPLIKATRAEDVKKAIKHAKIEAFTEIVSWPELFKLQQMIKNNTIDARQDKTTGEPIPEIPRFVRELIINNEPFANYTNYNSFDFAGDKTHIRALIEDCLKHPDEYKLYQMILDNPIDAKFDKTTDEPIPDMPAQVKQAIKDGDIVAPNEYPGNQNIMDVREFIEHYLNNENLYKIRALILDNNIDMSDPNTGKPIYPITKEVKNFVQSQKIGTRYARPNGEWDGIDVNKLIKSCLKNPELYELYELIKNNDIDAKCDRATGIEFPNVPKYLRERIKSSSVTDIYSYGLSDLNYYATKFKETKNHFYGMKRVELQKYLENITDENGNKITDINRLNPDEIIKQFDSLFGIENKNIILDTIKDNILTDKTNPDYNKTIAEFINETKDAKSDDIKLLSELAKNSDKWEVRTTVIRTLNEPKTGKDNLIDSKIENRAEYVTKETEDMINRLLDLKENCDNSLLNIDNILYLTDLISKEHNKNNRTIMFDEIIKLLQQKNIHGKYLLNKDNIKLLINSDDLKLLYENPEIEIQSYLNTLSKYQKETVQAGYVEININQLIREIYKENPEISDIEPKLKTKLQTKILESFKGNPDVQGEIVSFAEKADYELIKNTIESYRYIIEDPTKITMEEILPTDDQKTREDKNNRNMNAITETRNKLFIEKLNNMNPTVLMHDIEIGLLDITDMEYKTILQNDFNKLKNNERFNSSQVKQLQNIRSAANAYKAANGIGLDIIEKSYSQDFIKYMASKYPIISKLIINEPSAKIFDIFKGIRADIEADMKYFLTIDYCKNNSDNYADYLYEKVYLQNEKFPQTLKDKCMELYQKYGVKIFISNNLDSVENAINHIEAELNEWKSASNGEAFMPPVLDLLRAKQSYVDTESAYGQGVSAGFSETANGAISINGNQLSLMNYLTGFHGLKTILRHEMTHSNDSKHLINFPEGYLVYKENSRTLDVTKCKFYDEFVTIGIPKTHISYAYNNPAEFIAVASEGDLSKASPEFKTVLVEFGMPKWRFKMQ